MKRSRTLSSICARSGRRCGWVFAVDLKDVFTEIGFNDFDIGRLQHRIQPDFLAQHALAFTRFLDRMALRDVGRVDSLLRRFSPQDNRTVGLHPGFGLFEQIGRC